MLIGARAYLADGSMLFCEVKEEGQLLQVHQESVEVSMAYFWKVRVIAHDGVHWFIDPRLDDVKPFWRVWVFLNQWKPLQRLQMRPMKILLEMPISDSMVNLL